MLYNEIIENFSQKMLFGGSYEEAIEWLSFALSHLSFEMCHCHVSQVLKFYLLGCHLLCFVASYYKTLLVLHSAQVEQVCCKQPR